MEEVSATEVSLKDKKNNLQDTTIAAEDLRWVTSSLYDCYDGRFHKQNDNFVNFCQSANFKRENVIRDVCKGNREAVFSNVPILKEREETKQAYVVPENCRKILPVQFSKRSNFTAERCFQVNLCIESKDFHLGSFIFEVHPKMNVRLLKLKVEKELEIPSQYQKYIFNKTIALDSDMLLSQYGVLPGSSIFLYLDSNAKLNFENICNKLHSVSNEKFYPYTYGSSSEKSLSCFNVERKNIGAEKNESEALHVHPESALGSVRKNNKSMYPQNKVVTNIFHRRTSDLIPQKKKNKVAERRISTPFLHYTTENSTLCDSLSSKRKLNIEDSKILTTPNDSTNGEEGVIEITHSPNTGLGISSSTTSDSTHSFKEKFPAKNKVLPTKIPIRKSPIKICNRNLSLPIENLGDHFKEKRFLNIDTNLSSEPNHLSVCNEIAPNYISKNQSPDGTEIKLGSFPKNHQISNDHELTANGCRKQSLLTRLKLKERTQFRTVRSASVGEAELNISVKENAEKLMESSKIPNLECTEGLHENSNESNSNNENCKLGDFKSLLVKEDLSRDEHYFEEVCPETQSIENNVKSTIEDISNEESDNNLKEDIKKEEREHNENYKNILQIENLSLVKSWEDFQCPVCFGEFLSGQGIVLHECLHTFCVLCLSSYVEYAEEALIKCPYRDYEYSCQSHLQQREIKSLVSSEVYERYLQRSITTAESIADKSFHCKTPDCSGWCVYEDNIIIFHCPVCSHYNCLNCGAIHEGFNCRQYQDQLKKLKTIDPDSQKTLDLLERMIEEGKAIKCPRCNLVLMKKWGCDWLKCAICLTEICWITKGPRWGPNGRGDTSGGCKCGVDGVKCHPTCTYCH